MKKIVLVILVLFWVSGHAQRGKLRIAYIDMEMILDSMPEYQQALRELDARVQNWKRQLDRMTAEIEELKKELEAEKLMLTEDLLKEKKEIIQFKEEQRLKFQLEKFGPSGDYVLQKQLILKPVQDRVFNAVAKLVKTRHYDLVFDKSNENSGIVHVSPKLDITPQVLKILRRERIVDQRKKKHKQSIREKYEERKKQWQDKKAEMEKKEPKKTTKELYEERKKKWKEAREKEAKKENETDKENP